MDRAEQAEETLVEKDNLLSAITHVNQETTLKEKDILSLLAFEKKFPKSNTFDYFRKLLNHNLITTQDVSLMYEILFLIGNKRLWTSVKEIMVADNGKVPDYKYDVTKESKHFSNFRLALIEVGHQFTGDLTALKCLYELKEDFSCIWKLLLHLDEKLILNQSDVSTLKKFQRHLQKVGDSRGSITIEKYEQETVDIDIADSSNPTDIGQSLPYEHQLLQKQIETQLIKCIETKKRVHKTAEKCRVRLVQTGKDMKNKIDDVVSVRIRGLEKTKQNKISKLEQKIKQLELFLKEISKTSISDSLMDEIKGCCPDCIGYFKPISNIQDDLKKFEDMVNEYCQCVDYIPVDTSKCSISFPKICKFENNETIRVEVDLRDSAGNPVTKSHEDTPVSAHLILQNSENQGNYELDKSQLENRCTLQFKCKSKNTGLWRLGPAYVCGENISKPIDFNLTEIMKWQEPQHVFDVCFTSQRKYLLCCNNTNTIVRFDRSSSCECFSTGDKSKFFNICCIDSKIFLTETNAKEIIVLDMLNEMKWEISQFGKGDFGDKGIPQGIAVSKESGNVHVYVSNNVGNCVNHYINEKLCKQITILSTPDNRTVSISPWFLDVTHTNDKLFICNNKATHSSSGDEDDSEISSNTCFVEVLDMKSNMCVKSLKCDYAVCVDEEYNIFLGMKSRILMYDKDFKFVKAIYSEECSLGLSASNGRLAVVYGNSINIYQY
ncbi:uncharacterized protein [Antedon mediterranea]|uniref:uncharacterized protein isoform X2 n=1 Tax=Antedon mediterranea TaxID=105859 RepID=UPI003AF87805